MAQRDRERKKVLIRVCVCLQIVHRMERQINPSLQESDKRKQKKEKVEMKKQLQGIPLETVVEDEKPLPEWRRKDKKKV